MGTFHPDEVNFAFGMFCPELTKSDLAKYPMARDRWLNYAETFDGKPTFIAAETDDQGIIKPDYVWCKAAPKGKGYYHVLTKTVYVNLYTRLMSTGPPGGGCCGGGGGKPSDARAADAWDTARRVIYARSRCSRPDDVAAAEQQIDHMAGTKLNPVHGLKA